MLRIRKSFRSLFGAKYEPVGEVCDGLGVGYCEDESGSFTDWLLHIQRVRRLVENWDRATASTEDHRPYWKDLRSPWLHIELVERGGQPGIAFVPDSLLSAIDLQFYQAISGMTEIKACEHCGTWFERGPGRDRRGKSRFCSDSCRFKFHNARRVKGESQ